MNCVVLFFSLRLEMKAMRRLAVVFLLCWLQAEAQPAYMYLTSNERSVLAFQGGRRHAVAYRDALSRLLQGNESVLHFGTGSGVTAALLARACRAAGAYLYTVEADRHSALVAQRIIDAEGLAEHASVLASVSHLTGSAPSVVLFSPPPSGSLLAEGHLKLLAKARQLAAPGARVLPRWGRQWLVFSESPQWDNLTRVTSVDGLDLSPLNRLRKREFGWKRDLSFETFVWRELTAPVTLLEVDFKGAGGDVPARRTFHVPVQHAGVVHAACSHMQLLEDHERLIAQEGALCASVFDDTAGPSGVLEVQRGDKLEVTVEILHRRGGIHFELAAVERRRHVGEL